MNVVLSILIFVLGVFVVSSLGAAINSIEVSLIGGFIVGMISVCVFLWE